MRILILTQKVDNKDPVLGFFHKWIEELAKINSSIIVIALGVGCYSFSDNVKVLSLGKEKGRNRLTYITNFYRYIWQERKNYDQVFVHMNQEYIILGGLLWKCLNKRIYLWRNHAKGSLITKISVFLSDKVFCTSPSSFTAKFKKTKFMPVGVDLDFFKPNSKVRKVSNSILLLGRIAPVKNIELFIDVLNQLKNDGAVFTVVIAGGVDTKHLNYDKFLRNKILKLGLNDEVKFIGPVSKIESLYLYRSMSVYVNLTPSGSLDKTIFEALASSTKVLVMNSYFMDKLPSSWVVSERSDVKSISCALDNLLDYQISDVDREKLMSLVEKNSLSNLVNEIIKSMK